MQLYALMALDVLTTYWAIENNSCVFEANPLYSKYPKLGELAAGKMLAAPFVRYTTERELLWVNQLYAGVILNNIKNRYATC